MKKFTTFCTWFCRFHGADFSLQEATAQRLENDSRSPAARDPASGDRYPTLNACDRAYPREEPLPLLPPWKASNSCTLLRVGS